MFSPRTSSSLDVLSHIIVQLQQLQLSSSCSTGGGGACSYAPPMGTGSPGGPCWFHASPAPGGSFTVIERVVLVWLWKKEQLEGKGKEKERVRERGE